MVLFTKHIIRREIVAESVSKLSLKFQIVNSLGFVHCMLSAATTHLCCHSVKATVDNR